MTSHRRRRRLGATLTVTAGISALLVALLFALGSAKRATVSATVSAAPNVDIRGSVPGPAERADALSPGAVGPGSVSTLQLPARDAPGGSHAVWVYRPGVPDSANLPVLYFLHGLPGTARDLAGTGIVSMLDAAFVHHRLRPFVVVAPDGNSTGAADPEWADSTDGSVRVESFVTGPLITAVEGLNRRDRNHRAIAGFSMGGYGAMNLAIRHPDLYGQVVSLAGYFGLDDESGIFATARAQTANRPDAHVHRAAALRVMLVEGSNDHEPVVTGEAKRFAALLRRDGQHPVVDIPPADHSLDLVRDELPEVVAFLEQGWSS